jgi:hypothetical protein
LAPQDLCTFELGLCDQDHWELENLDKVVFDLLDSKPQFAKSNNFIDNLYMSSKFDKKPIKVVLISDLHIDYGYIEGANTNCTG